MPNFFWVNQGKTYDEERAAGLLWAPERSPTGSVLVHWETMTLLRPGDMIFTYSKGLRGHAIATSSAVHMARPYAAGSLYTPSQGGRAVFCTYTPVVPSVPLTTIQANATLVAALKAAPNPVLDVNGDVAQKYLCQISAFAAAELAALVGGYPASPPPPLAPTTVQRLLDARVGQGQFRQDLIGAFGSACAMTGLAHTALLRASHIKPWSISTDQERLDPNNGILLAAGVDAAFDKGFISFDESGQLLVKQTLTAKDREALGIPAGAYVLTAHMQSPDRMRFMAWHRANFQH